jgi:hypothetical protein
MAFPPQRISIKRRRDEDPVSTLCMCLNLARSAGPAVPGRLYSANSGATDIQTDSASTPQRERKRHRSEYVFKRVHEYPEMGRDISKSGGMVGGKEAMRASSMAAGGRAGGAGGGIKRTETGVPIVIALEDGHEKKSTLDRGQVQVLAIGPSAPAVSEEKKMEQMGSDTTLLPPVTAMTMATAVVSEENKVGRSDEATFLSTATVTPPAAKELTPEEKLKAMGISLGTLSPKKKRAMSHSTSPTEMPVVKKLRRFRLQRRSTDTSNQRATSPAFRGIKKTRKSPKLGAVFVEEKSKGRDEDKKRWDAPETETEEPIDADGDRKVPGDAMSVDPQTTTTPLPDQSKTQTQTQKKPNRDKEESARRAIRIATSSFGAGKLKYQPRPPPPRPQRATTANGIRSGTQQMPVPDAATQDPVDDEDALTAKLEAFTMEVLSESNNGGVPVYPAPTSTRKPRRQHSDAMSSSSDSDSEGDYVMDTYIRVPLSPSQAGVPDPTDLAEQMAQDVGILHIPREDEELLVDWFVDEHSSSEERDEWEEDSNAEDAVGNDYPDEEELGEEGGVESDDDGEYEEYEYKGMGRESGRRFRKRVEGDSDYKDDEDDGADDEHGDGADGFQGGEDWAWEVR